MLDTTTSRPSGTREQSFRCPAERPDSCGTSPRQAGVLADMSVSCRPLQGDQALHDDYRPAHPDFYLPAPDFPAVLSIERRLDAPRVIGSGNVWDGVSAA